MNPNQLMQNNRFTYKKEYANWNPEPQRPRSRELDMIDLLLVNNLNKKQTSLPQLSNSAIQPIAQTQRISPIPIHPQYQHFTPLPIQQAYPIQFFPSAIQYKSPPPKLEQIKIQEPKVDKSVNAVVQKIPKKEKKQQNDYYTHRYFQVPPAIMIVNPPPPPQPKRKKRKNKIITQLDILREIKTIKELEKGEYEVESPVSSESSVIKVQKPRKQRLKPVPKPPYYDLTADQIRFKDLSKLRSDHNWRMFFLHFAFIVFKRNELLKITKEKKLLAQNSVPQMEEQFKQEIKNLAQTVSNPIVQKLAQQNANLRVVESTTQKLTDARIKQNSANLKQYVIQVIQAVQKLNITQLDYLESITQDGQYLLPDKHTRFELSRLSYSALGSLKEMQPGKQNMMLLVNFWIKNFLVQSFPETQKSLQNINETMQSNIKTITSALYEIAIQTSKNGAQPIKNNTKDLPVEVKTKEKQDNTIKIANFKETQDEITFYNVCQQQKADEPLLYPLYTTREMDRFLDGERQFMSEMIGQMNGWCSSILSKIAQKRQQRLDATFQKRKELIDQVNSKILEPKKKQVTQIMKDKRMDYQKWSVELKQLKQKIKEEGEKNEKMKLEYDEAVKKQQERQDKLIALGV